MAGLFGTLGTANKGLNTQQVALSTTGHNIANANTVGYSRQRVNMQADKAYHYTGVGQIGTGVKVSSVIRVVDDFLIGNIRTEKSAFTYNQQKAGVLADLEMILNETSSGKGLSANLATYFDAWNKLSENPELDNAKTIVLENGNVLTDTINHMAQQMTDLAQNSITNFEQSTLNFNANLKQLEILNKQIYKISNDGSVPNDLLDQRDSVLDELSAFAKIDTVFDQYGRASINLDGQEILGSNNLKTISVVVGKSKTGESLVSHGGNSLESRMSVDEEYPIGQILVNDSKDANSPFVQVEMLSGGARGFQESISELAIRTNELNSFVYNLATAVNTIHSDGGQSVNFFDIDTLTEGNHALKLKINQVIRDEPSKINASSDLKNPEVGDGGRAGAIAKLKDVRLRYPANFHNKYDPKTMTIASDDGGLTFLGAYTDIVTKNGISKQQADNTLNSQDYILSQLEQRRDSISGVNINEEVADVIRYQRAFQANSRVISVISEMLDTLINRTGV